MIWEVFPPYSLHPVVPGIFGDGTDRVFNGLVSFVAADRGYGRVKLLGEELAGILGIKRDTCQQLLRTGPVRGIAKPGQVIFDDGTGIDRRGHILQPLHILNPVPYRANRAWLAHDIADSQIVGGMEHVICRVYSRA